MNYGREQNEDAGDIVKKPRRERSNGDRGRRNDSARAPKAEGGKVENA